MASGNAPSLWSVAAKNVLMPSHKRKEQQKERIMLWYKEWNQVEKDLFLGEFVKFFLDVIPLPHDVDELSKAMGSMEVRDEPPATFFHCQMRTIWVWFKEWSDNNKTDLMMRLGDDFFRVFGQQNHFSYLAIHR